MQEAASEGGGGSVCVVVVAAGGFWGVYKYCARVGLSPRFRSQTKALDTTQRR